MHIKEPSWVVKSREEGKVFFDTLKNHETKDFPKDFSLDAVHLADYQKDFFHVKKENKISCMDLQEAFSQYGKIVKEHFGRLLKMEDKVSAFSSAFWNAGLFVYVPQNTVCTLPLTIASQQSSKPILSRILFFIGRGSELTIIEDSKKGKSPFYGKAVEVFVGENSRVTYIDIKNSQDAQVLGMKKCSLAKDAVLNWVTLGIGGGKGVYEIISFLEGEGSKTKNAVAFLGVKDQQIGIYTKAVHYSPRTESRLFTKGVVSGTSKAKLGGLIEIAKNAKNADGHQKLEALIVNEGAKVDAVPDLRIDNNDVTCSHGSSVTHVDTEKLFYMMSRGIIKKDAKKMIVEGFLGSIVDTINNESLRKKICGRISSTLEREQ